MPAAATPLPAAFMASPPRHALLLLPHARADALPAPAAAATRRCLRHAALARCAFIGAADVERSAAAPRTLRERRCFAAARYVSVCVSHIFAALPPLSPRRFRLMRRRFSFSIIRHYDSFTASMCHCFAAADYAIITDVMTASHCCQCARWRAAPRDAAALRACALRQAPRV